MLTCTFLTRPSDLHSLAREFIKQQLSEFLSEIGIEVEYALASKHTEDFHSVSAFVSNLNIYSPQSNRGAGKVVPALN
jgi:hypothetical protein